MAFGLLGDAEELWQNQRKAVQIAGINYTAAVSVGVLLGEKMRAQGSGRIIAMSSAAGERVRRSNFVYGSTKAGLDGFYLGLGEALREFGVRVLVIRPGQVRTKTTIDALEGHRRQGGPVHRRQGVRRRTRRHRVGQGQGPGVGAGRVPVRDDGAAARPAADLPQAADLTSGALAGAATDRRPDGWPPSSWPSLVAGGRRWSRSPASSGPRSTRRNQLHALTTVGQFVCLAGLFAAGLAVAHAAGSWLARAVAVVFLSAFSVVTLAMPLGATKLYLFGVSVDQQFRTEYLTRLTDTAAPHDMTYIGLPPFYPPGWFWLGGRLADLTGTPAWEMFKPWSIISITAAIVVAFVLWAAMIRFELALVVSTATAAATLAYAPAEPYAAIITVLLPPVFVLAWSGLRGTTASSGAAGRPSSASALFLGARRAVLHAAARLRRVHAGDHGAARSPSPAAAGTRCCGWPSSPSSPARIALIGWGPYLLAAARGTPADTGTAQHYLPADGAQLTFPMLRLHPARRAVHGRHAVAGGLRAQLHPRGRARRRACSPSTRGRCCRW